MKDFSYAAAATVEEAVSLLSAGGERAKVLAGGTDVIVQLREGLREADLVVDVKHVPDLMVLDYSPQRGLRLGAATPCHRIYGDPEVANVYAGLVDAAKIIGGWQIQSRASIGGNLCNSSPAADSTPALIAYGAVCHIAGPDGIRRVPVESFCTGVGRNCLARGELLVCLELPAQPPRSGARYLRFIPRNEMDIAVVGVGAWVQIDASASKIERARIALGAVAPTPLFAKEASDFLAGKPATLETYREAGEVAKRIARPISDKRGPAEYRTHLVGVLVGRALEGAVQRANSAG